MTQALATRSQRLVDVAMGRQPADVVIRAGRWVCVQSGEILEHTDLAVSGDRIAFVGPDARHTIGAGTRIIEAEDRYLVPGLLDGHMHVESGMLTVTEFARAVIPHGTTGMFIDPHEIANVLGLAGVRLVFDEAAVQPIHVWVEVPACVPSAPGLETPGAVFGPEQVAEALSWPGVIGLGEVMDYPGVYGGDAKMHREMASARQSGKVIGGHYASPDLGLAFHGYVAGGPEDDHEGTRAEDAVARVRQGMKAMLRQGSAWHDVAAQVAAITKAGLDPRHFLLVTDDSHCETLVSEGHVNRAVQVAMQHGVDPIVAIQMATLNTAEHFGVARDVGQIAPGRFADVLLVRDLRQLKPEVVLGRGQVIAEHGRILVPRPAFAYPAAARSSVRLARPLIADDFVLRAPHGKSVRAHVIGLVENQAPTRHLEFVLEPQDGRVLPDRERDLSLVAVIDRHQGSGRIQLGLVHGIGFTSQAAFASTVVHDSHQLIVVGTDPEDMARAANELAACGGGQIVVRQGEILGRVQLPIAGLISDAPAETVAAEAQSVLNGLRACGCAMNNANMQLSLLGLVVIPELRISDLGLVDVERFAFIPMLEPAAEAE
ncbi:MAG: adenine deaminase [Anaerolineales bacterium]|nr:adenine deaminase [Anaerolineales bacterium]